MGGMGGKGGEGGRKPPPSTQLKRGGAGVRKGSPKSRQHAAKPPATASGARRCSAADSE